MLRRTSAVIAIFLYSQLDFATLFCIKRMLNKEQEFGICAIHNGKASCRSWVCCWRAAGGSGCAIARDVGKVEGMGLA